MRVLIAGIDGYLGWALAQYLVKKGHTVGGADMGLRRNWVEEMGSYSAIPILETTERLEAFKNAYGSALQYWHGDLREYDFVRQIFESFSPDAVVQFGECPSAPYSMIDREHAVFVQVNNVVTTFNLIYAIRDISPAAHLIKLGTMGEYGTPAVDIPEGFFEVEYRGRTDTLPFPRQAGSWYHWSKVHGSNNVMFACRMYGLRATDVMQGVVFGTRIEDKALPAALATRLDFDQAFGTAINRFSCQAVIGHPLTPFGKGHQKRGFIPLRDSMRCLQLAIENPAAKGEYRVFNQFAEVYDITELANKVREVARERGLVAEIRNLENPRRELEDHYYRPDHQKLKDLGYEPSQDVTGEVRQMLEDLMPHAGRIKSREHVLLPDVRWDGRRQSVTFVENSSQAEKENTRRA